MKRKVDFIDMEIIKVIGFGDILDKKSEGYRREYWNDNVIYCEKE